jgi:hypothetical protein
MPNTIIPYYGKEAEKVTVHLRTSIVSVGEMRQYLVFWFWDFTFLFSSRQNIDRTRIEPISALKTKMSEQRKRLLLIFSVKCLSRNFLRFSSGTKSIY